MQYEAKLRGCELDQNDILQLSEQIRVKKLWQVFAAMHSYY